MVRKLTDLPVHLLPDTINNIRAHPHFVGLSTLVSESPGIRPGFHSFREGGPAMEYKTYPYPVQFRYLVRRNEYAPVTAGFLSLGDAEAYALSVGGTVLAADRNPRNAGRMPVYEEQEKQAIRERIQQGLTLRSIAEEFHCSIGFVHKLKHEHGD